MAQRLFYKILLTLAQPVVRKLVTAVDLALRRRQSLAAGPLSDLRDAPEHFRDVDRGCRREQKRQAISTRPLA